MHHREGAAQASRGGRSAALIVSGEPGTGKTELLHHARARAGDALVLASTGSEAESHLAFAGLADLLGPVTGLIDGLAPHGGKRLRRRSGPRSGAGPSA